MVTTKMYPGPKVIKRFPCSTRLIMKLYLLINSKSVISSVVVLLSLAECEIFYALPYHVNKKNAIINWHFHIYQKGNFHAQLS